MCVCVCVCMGVCMGVHMNVRMCVRMHARVCVHALAWVCDGGGGGTVFPFQIKCHFKISHTYGYCVMFSYTHTLCDVR
jgi:hypothetical protein